MELDESGNILALSLQEEIAGFPEIAGFGMIFPLFEPDLVWQPDGLLLVALAETCIEGDDPTSGSTSSIPLP